MKTLQETILELAKSQSVVQATLREVGPPRRYRRPAQWPTPLDVEGFRECIDMRPPGGAEFGKTEVFYLSVRDHDPRAGQRIGRRTVRTARTADARNPRPACPRHDGRAGADRRDGGRRSGHANRSSLSAFEAKIGADLAELRNLNADIGGQSEVSQELQAIEAERRANEASRQENVRLLEAAGRRAG